MSILMQSKRLVCAMLLISAIVLSGCLAAQPAAAGFLAQPAAVAAVPGEKEQMLDYLKKALEDFAVIDALIEDRDLGLMEDYDADAEAMSAGDTDRYLDLLSDYSKRIDDRITEIKTRNTPNHPDITLYKAAALAQLELADEIVMEYTQLLNYYHVMLRMQDSMDNLDLAGSDDLVAIYTTFSETIEKVVKDLKDSNVPSFWKSMNDNMIAALNEFNDAVLYYLIAIEMNDPVRMNSAVYRMGMLERKLGRIYADSDRDSRERDEKLKNDLKKSQATVKDLRQWLQSNVNLLGGK